MRLKCLVKVCLVVWSMQTFYGYGQNVVFIREGSIEYERRFNQYSIFDTEQDWGRNYRETEPQFRSDRFTLDFSDAQSLYKPNGLISAPKSFYLALPAQDNVVFKDHRNRQILTQKKIVENIFLVKSTGDAIRWKITSETRTIAGFECKRANALVFDSVFIVAYYTEQIPVSSGPETFSGLPGMILGLAVPEIHMTWFATKVFARQVLVRSPLDQGNKILSQSEVQSKIRGAFLDHGRFASIFNLIAIL